MNQKPGKLTRRLERVVKGFSNHRRIEIMMFLAREPELSLAEITERLNVNFRTVSEHLRRLVYAGLVMKRNEANFVRHALTPSGKSILKFLGTLE